MQIGIDATAIPSNRVGAGNYIFSLVRGLANMDADNRYVIFAKAEHINEWKIEQPNFQFIPSASRLRPLRLLWEQILLPILVQQYALDVLHSPHYTMPLGVPCRSVVTFCDMTFFLYPEVHSRSKRIFFQQMMRWSARRATALVAISQSTANDVLRWLKVPSDRVYPVLLAADESFRPIAHRADVESICKKYSLKPGEYALYVGILEPRKNIPALLQAYRRIVDRGVKSPLVIVGRRGWLFDEIFGTVQKLKLEDKVSFTGYVPDNELPYLYNGARVFVYPSIYEGFGLPVLEALACGTPVITSNVSSMPEIVGDAGMLVDPHDHSQLAEALESVIADDSLHRSLCERSLRRAAQFSWERTAKETLQVYRRVCGEHH